MVYVPPSPSTYRGMPSNQILEFKFSPNIDFTEAIFTRFSGKSLNSSLQTSQWSHHLEYPSVKLKLIAGSFIFCQGWDGAALGLAVICGSSSCARATESLNSLAEP